jgi:hypothetical protein
MEEGTNKDSLPESLKELIEDQMFPDILVLEEGGKNFIWEYQHERISLHPTQFREVWPEYE